MHYCADILVVGDDWNTIKGEEYMRDNGKKVIFLPRTRGVSSSMLRGVEEAGDAIPVEGSEYWEHNLQSGMQQSEFTSRPVPQFEVKSDKANP